MRTFWCLQEKYTKHVDETFFFSRQKSDSLAVNSRNSIDCWIMSVGLSARGSLNPLQLGLGQYESVPQATGAAQLFIRHHCLRVYYCPQNKRSTCLTIQKYTWSFWSAMCLTQDHTVSMTSQPGQSDALCMMASFKWTKSHDGDPRPQVFQCQTFW